MPASAVPTINAFQLLSALSSLRHNTPLYLLEITRKYGDFVRYKVGNVNAVVLNHPDAIKHILQDNHRNYTKDTIQYNALSKITGKGLLTADGDLWFRNRRLQQPAFVRPRLVRLDEVVIPAAQQMMEQWQTAMQRGEAVDIDAAMMRLALTVVGQAMFGVNLAEDATELTEATMTALDHIIYLTRNPISPPEWFPTAENRKFRTALTRLDAAIAALIARRRLAKEPKEDLLGMLLAAQTQADPPLTEQQLRDELITILVAGHETVASALTWSWYLLAKYPAEWQTLHHEVRAALQGSVPTVADLERLPFTAQVFDEALRLYPPAWLITRKAIAEDTIRGEIITPGTLIIISTYAIHRHPQFWRQPEQFVPARFAPSEENTRPRYAYIPFGGGPRLCIGNNFALTEARLVLAAVTQRFRLVLEQGQAVQMDALVTLRPHGGLPMKLQPVD